MHSRELACLLLGILILLVGIGLLLYFVWEVDHEVEVRARRGRYSGRTLAVGAGHVHEFLGVAFAREPRHNLRFHKPLPVDKSWLLQPALEMKKRCVQDRDHGLQDSEYDVGEDCLHLNIWTPMLPDHCRSNCEPRTVVVFFGGRDFQYGGNAHSLYRGELLALYADTVVVIPNYRLGPFGFLNGRIVDITGNAGLYDQKMALDWVQENIKFFGGNPNEVIPVGHDAGAISLGHHLFSMERHWVQDVKRVVLLTTSLLRPYADNTHRALQNTLHLGWVALCYPEEGVDMVVECLQRKAASRVMKAARHSYHLAPIFVPTYDKTRAPLTSIRLENSSSIISWLKDKVFLLGNVADEGSFEYSMFLQRLGDLKRVLPEGAFPNITAAIYRFFADLPLEGHTQEIVDEYKKSYRNNSFDEKTLWKSILGDMLAYCPMQYLAEILSAHGSKVYTFVLGQRHDFHGSGPAQRYDDLHFLFGTPLRFNKGQYERDKERTMTFISRWAAFIKSGALPTSQGYGAWPQFSPRNPETIFVSPGNDMRVMKTYRAEQCDFLRRYLFSKRLL
ncbi:acetylcholinesterase-1-like [Amblyomma americanum]